MFPQSGPQKDPLSLWALCTPSPFAPGCDTPGYCPPNMKQDKTVVEYIYKVCFQNSNKNT